MKATWKVIHKLPYYMHQFMISLSFEYEENGRFLTNTFESCDRTGCVIAQHNSNEAYVVICEWLLRITDIELALADYLNEKYIFPR